MLQVTESEIKNRLAFDNPWWEIGRGIDERLPKLPERAYLPRLLELIRDRSVRRAVVLMGPRRVGKTVMLYQSVQRLLAEGVAPKSVFYVSLDNPTYVGISLDKLVGMFRDIHGHAHTAELLILFDEIQYLQGWEVHLKSLVDSYPSIKFVASGSAAAALRMKSNESGAGRFTDFLLPPLTFAEFVRFRGFPEDLEIDALNREFVAYLNYGGFPEAVISKSVQQNLTRFLGNDIIDKVLLRDLPSLYGIESPQDLRRFFAVVAYNSGQEVNLDALSKASGVAKNTIKKFIEYLEAAFLIHRVFRVDQSARRFQRATHFKLYLTNPCLRAALFGAVEENDYQRLGQLAETSVFAQWMQNSLVNDVYYARWGDKEVDLVALTPATQEVYHCVEVKFTDRVAEKHYLKEIWPLIGFGKMHKIGVDVLTRSFKGADTADGVKIFFTPVSVYCMNFGKTAIEIPLRMGKHPRRIQAT